VEARFFFSPMSSRPALGPTQPSIQRVPGALSPGIKRPGREADHSDPTSAEVKNTWIYTSTPPHVLMAKPLISEAQEQLYLPFTGNKLDILRWQFTSCFVFCPF
jgi:hypothetical protein